MPASAFIENAAIWSRSGPMILAASATPPAPSPPPSALREWMLGRYAGYAASRRRISVMIWLWEFFRASIGSA